MVNGMPKQKEDVMGGLSHAPANSGFTVANLKELTPLQIIEADVQKFGLKEDPKRTYAALIQLTKKPKYRIIRANNSLLFIENKGKGFANAVLFTADTDEDVVKSVQHFMFALKKGGF
jgi:hypothetical protein